MTDSANDPARDRDRGARAAVASWLGVLFVLILTVVAAGGWVRLSGSGLSIPDWPFIHVGETRTLLPPITDEGWQAVRATFDRDQAILRERLASGAIGIGSLGRVPEDMATFKRMFLIEWGHRGAAALVGIVSAACLVVLLRRKSLRQEVGGLFGGACALIVFQAALGGVLVKSGTATHWLFLHLGTAAVILCLIVWTILRLVATGPRPSPDDLIARRGLRIAAHVAVAATWLQIMLGALVAGSRGDEQGDSVHFSSTWPTMGGYWIPSLWESNRSLGWNLLDNAWLHQWVHRWFAWVAMAAIASVFWYAYRAPVGPRLRLSLRVVASFAGVQVLLGLANVFLTHPILVSLAHLVMAMFLLTALILVLYDSRREPTEVPA